ncbi:MAG TPA: cytochrome c peroxidase [Candidatus Competibacter sp.]|nr:cytochrome-c peroxidase [Candidatus Competibacteraceae bacterium]HRC71851.1 cytochrome c peroxidase [Candidatus Competibacter sp.]
MPAKIVLFLTAFIMAPWANSEPLGLPPLPVPVDNPQTPEKIALGAKLFNDRRFSTTGEIACAHCHAPEKAFTDLKTVSEGINGLTGTRNAPTVINAAYFKSQFWDGREPSLERQSTQPLLNPVEMALPNHDPVLKIARTDPDYQKAFRAVFGKSGEAVTMVEVSRAIAAFERTLIAGDSPFDRYYFGGETGALTPAQVRGFALFLNEGRCVSCHTVEQDHALFTDHRFHNIGVGINQIQDQVPGLATAFLEAKARGANVDKAVLGDKKTSELGRFAVTSLVDELGAFKTPTLRNVAVTAPYMHDGSLKTLREVMVHYNNGGVNRQGERVNAYLSGGIRPLHLTDTQIDDLVAFMEALTSPQYANVATATQTTPQPTTTGSKP